MTQALPSIPSSKRTFGRSGGSSAGALRPCTVGITMRAHGEVPRTYQPSHSKGAQRKRRLARGLLRWDFDRQLCAEPTRRIATVTLTVADADPQAAVGLVYRFWRRVRQQWLGTRYFCWLELQARGAVHYHCVWLNPPHVKRVNLIAWVARQWEGGRTQVRFADGRGGLRREVDYALGYAKKMGKKAYQQRYDDVPRQLRTFMSQRLEIPPKEVDEHLELEVWEYHGPTLVKDFDSPDSGVRTTYIPEELVYVGTRVHDVPPGGRCTALDRRRPKRGPPAAGHAAPRLIT
jgi:hypothetical protein